MQLDELIPSISSSFSSRMYTEVCHLAMVFDLGSPTSTGKLIDTDIRAFAGTSTTICKLMAHVYPLAVIWFVVAIWAFTLKREMGLETICLRPIGKSVKRLIPLRAHLNTPATIILIAYGSRNLTTLPHVRPAVV